MKSVPHGESISDVEVTNVGPTGFWVWIDDRELFVAFSSFPWFRDATIAQLTYVERPSAQHLHWPDLDIDLSLDSIANPDAYPLASRKGVTSAELKAAAVRERRIP